MLDYFDIKETNKIEKILSEIEKYKDKFLRFSDEQFSEQTLEFRKRLYYGESLNSLLPEAYALVFETIKRVYGIEPYKTQILGAIALNQNRMAEMKTGEGKTLTALFPAYLNALKGSPVHIMTANDYLANRDCEIARPVYEKLGIVVSCVNSDQIKTKKQEAYMSDVVYGTISSFGFDYLRDNLAYNKNDKVMRGLGFAIIDEADSLLLDQAGTPLIISNNLEMPDDQADLIMKVSHFVNALSEDDVVVNLKEKSASISDSGILKAEKYFKTADVNDINDLLYSLNNAVMAKYIYQKDKDYFVKDGKIVLIGQTTGRSMPSHKYKDGVQHAIEAKEGLEITPETRVAGSVTIQNFLKKYSRISGMSGTIKSSESELMNLYGLDVVQVPTNKPVIRKDRRDEFFMTKSEKYIAIVKDVMNSYKKGQPVLIGTVSVKESEILSEILSDAGIKHNLLNAKSYEEEAMIIANAGCFGSVTIATDMAGRGTDILLGGNAEEFAKLELINDGVPADLLDYVLITKTITDEKLQKLYNHFLSVKARYEKEIAENKQKVVKAGGLKVIGTEKHSSVRIDNQLRGRAGRQGEIGESRFYSSAEDSLIVESEKDNLFSQFDLNLNDKLKSQILEKINYIQKIKESMDYSARKAMVMFDQELNRQCEAFYSQREMILNMTNIDNFISKGIKIKVGEIVISVFAENKMVDSGKITKAVSDAFNYDLKCLAGHKKFNKDNIEEIVQEIADEIDEDYFRFKFSDKKSETVDCYDKVMLLKIMDNFFMDHLEKVEGYHKILGVKSLAMNDALGDYQRETHKMYDDGMKEILPELATKLFEIRAERFAKNSRKNDTDYLNRNMI